MLERAAPWNRDGGPSGGGRLLWVIALAAALVPLNTTMIVVALPDVITGLGSDLGAASWLVTGYLAAMAALHPIAGTLGDRFGRGRVFLWGAAAFAATSAAAAAAPAVGVLIALRLAQGAAGAMLLANGLGLIRELTPAGGLGRRVGLVYAAIPLGAAVGPGLAGALAAAGGWRAVLAVNVPLALVVLAGALRAVPLRAPRPGIRFDLVGAVLLTFVLVVVAWVLSGDLLTHPAGAAALAVALLAGWALLLWERRHPSPVVPAALLGRGRFAVAAGAMLLANVTLHAVLLATPLLLGGRLGWGPGAIGASLSLFALASVLASPPGGRIADRVGRAAPAAIGLAVLAVALLGIAIDQVEPPIALVGCLVLAGLGIGLSTPALQTAAVEAAPVSGAGAAAGLFATARYVGGIIGAALVAGGLGPGADGASDVTALFVAMAAAAALAALLSLRLRPSDRLLLTGAEPRVASAAS